MLGRMAALAFAMEAVNDIAAGLADAGKSDIRLEAAIAKMFNSEGGWRVAIVDAVEAALKQRLAR